MSKWDKLIMQICNLSKDIRFDELRKVLESYGDEMNSPKGGSSPVLWFFCGACSLIYPYYPANKIYLIFLFASKS